MRDRVDGLSDALGVTCAKVRGGLRFLGWVCWGRGVVRDRVEGLSDALGVTCAKVRGGLRFIRCVLGGGRT